MSLKTPDRVVGFLATALLSPSTEGDATEDAILTATVSCIGRYGLDRMSMDDVADAAGVGRATVFRRFGSKEELLRRTIAREGALLLEELKRSVADIADPVERLVEALVAAARLRRDNPVVARLVSDGSLVGLLRDPQLSRLVRSTAERELASLGLDVDLEALVEVGIRLFASLWVVPDLGLPTEDDETIRRLVRVVLAPVSASGKSGRLSRARDRR